MSKLHPRVLANFSSARVGGGISYALQQLRALAEFWPRDRLTVLTSLQNDQLITSEQSFPTKLIASSRSTIRRVTWEQAVLPRVSHSYDVLYAAGNFAPLFLTKIPTVLLVQNPHYFGQGVSVRRAGLANARAHLGSRQRVRAELEFWGSKASLRRATQVVAISESLAKEIRTTDPWVSDKLVVILTGASTWAEAREANALLSQGSDFFLSIANDSYHKQLADTVRAWSAAFEEAERVVPLVMVGSITQTRRVELSELAAERIRRALILLGSISDRRQIRWLLEHARATVLTTELEAFSLVPGEALSLGCPVIASDIPPHHEVTAGSAAQFFSVGDVVALERLLRSAGERSSTQASWAWPWSWSDNASSLASIFLQVAREK